MIAPNAYDGGLTKAGSGTLTLTAANTYNGGTKISTGVLAAGNNSALGTGPVNLAGGTLRLTGVATAFSSPGSIGIKFASGEDATTGLPASTNGINYGIASNGVAGIVQQANWNNVYNNAGSQGSLLNSSGTATSAQVSWSAPSTFSVWVPGNQWMGTNLSAPTNPNDQLTNSYLSNYAPQTVWDGTYTGLAPRAPAFPSVNVNLSGIPYASYKVYVYFDGAPWGGQKTWNNTANSGGNDAGGVTVVQGASSTTYWYESLTGANAYASIMANEGAGFGPTSPAGGGGFYYQTTQTVDIDGDPGANFAEYDGLSGGTVQISQSISGNVDNGGDGVLNDDTGIAAVQIVGNPTPIAFSPTALANTVNVTSNSTIDVTGASSAAVGNLTIGSNTLFLTGGGSAANSGYSLTVGPVDLSGTPTFDVANNGTGAGTLILGSLNDGGTACTITKADNGLLVLSSSATSLVQGTKVNISGGTLAVAAIGALGSFSQVTVSPGADFSLGADQQISALNGSGGVDLGSSATDRRQQRQPQQQLRWRDQRQRPAD